MRLSKIKLAGFKSFVDPAVLHLPGNLVGVVGPNGCGKSNIIDAVRWVMGESSARSLRGEAMSDVIFNGSASRKPVGQAFVELVFDNSQGRLGGPWASYAEIAIRRLAGRDGPSSYFLNGSRCRRRDIADLFLGTGLGPRSYAIIEQGMISRVVEARPEDLRLLVEEAAGISRYRERRRETETRLRHTRDNLDRLSDVREELNRQLQHLQRQARAAEQYRDYRTEERRLRVEWLTLRWRALQGELHGYEQAICEQETALAAQLAEQRRLEALLEAGRVRRLKLNEAFNAAQGRYYQSGAEISRLEQYLEHQRELQRRHHDDWQQTGQALEALEQQWAQDQEQHRALTAALLEAEPAIADLLADEAETATAWSSAETALREDQRHREAFNRHCGEVQRQIDVERTRIEHLHRQLLQDERRLERLRREQEQLTSTDLAAELAERCAVEQEAAGALHEAQEQLAQMEADLNTIRAARQPLGQQVRDWQERLQTGRGRLASLHTLQEAALGRQDRGVQAWLHTQGLADAPRLAEQLAVESGWEVAVEAILADWLDAICIPDLEAPVGAVHRAFSQGHLTLFELPPDHAPTTPVPALAADLLRARIQAPWPLASLLDGVRTVADLPEALARRADLPEGETLVTPEGIWCGRHWLRLTGNASDDSVLARERAIRQLEATLDNTALELEQQTMQLNRWRDRQRELEQHYRDQQQATNKAHRDLAHAQAESHTAQARCQQACSRSGALAAEQAEVEAQCAQDREQIQIIQLQLEAALLILEGLHREQAQLQQQSAQLQEDCRQCRTRAEAARQVSTRQAAALEALRVQVASANRALERLEVQRQQLRERRDRLALERPEHDQDRLAMAGEELADWLETRLAVEAELTKARQQLEAEDARLEAAEQGRSRCERQAEAWRRQIEEQRLASSEARIRQQNLREQVQELETTPETVLSTLPDSAAESDWLGRLEQIERRIQRLGPINLAAIEEFAQAAERQHYLDAQQADLLEALKTLEEAIRKMDRETRTRFRETFDQINVGLQELFPRLFGGGQSCLALTGEDALDAGITIMAKPPGKRIGSISLMSGGEKALTAIALVFAIFQLNPAPFCLLDEVDAPLDEANVRRFGALVEEMATRVQFVFITHNRATMEIAHQLAGVTMQEPGVSRLVAVDVAEAARLAGVC